MNVGIHFSNRQWEPPAEEAYRRLALARPATIKTCVHNQCGFDQVAVHRRLRKEYPTALIVGRLMGNGFAPENYWEQINALRDVVNAWEIGNEPNHPAEWSKGVDAWLAWFDATLSQYREWFPAVSWVFPGMAVNGTQESWWSECKAAMNRCDWVGVHCYWQFENMAHPTFGASYATLRQYTSQPQLVTEVGDSTPGRSSTDKATRYVAWAKSLPGYVCGSAVYILGGTADWAEFELDAAACAMLGAAHVEADMGTVLEKVDGFDYPCGAPDGDGYYIAAGLATQEYYDKYKAWHTGEDWNGTGGGDTDAGHQVYAVANGRVESVGTYPTWGKIVLIQHGEVWGQYAHLHEMLVKAGDVVRRGDVIGTIGHMVDAAGKPKGSAHLHFEIRRDKLPANQWNLSRDDVLRHYEAPSEYIRAHRPARNHLPEYEPASDVATLAQKARWWMEEEQRCREAGDDVRAGEIHESLIRLLYRVEAAAKGM